MMYMRHVDCGEELAPRANRGLGGPETFRDRRLVRLSAARWTIRVSWANAHTTDRL